MKQTRMVGDVWLTLYSSAHVGLWKAFSSFTKPSPLFVAF